MPLSASPEQLTPLTNVTPQGAQVDDAWRLGQSNLAVFSLCFLFMIMRYNTKFVKLHQYKTEYSKTYKKRLDFILKVRYVRT